MISDPEINRVFPKAFIAASAAQFEAEALSRLKGALQSLHAVSTQSEIAAQSFMTGTLGVRPFLNDRSLRHMVCANPTGQDGRVVDFVAMSSTQDGLVLVEAKSQLDSAQLKNGKLVGKFSNTMDELRAFYARGGQDCPPIRQAILTVSSVAISGRSSWSEADGMLAQHERVITVGRLGVPIEIVRL